MLLIGLFGAFFLGVLFGLLLSDPKKPRSGNFIA